VVELRGPDARRTGRRLPGLVGRFRSVRPRELVIAPGCRRAASLAQGRM